VSPTRYSTCPRCARRTAERLALLAEQLRAGYGDVPAAEYDARHARLVVARELRESHDTLAETYEVHLRVDADDVPVGVIEVTYGAHCARCGLTVDRDARWEFSSGEPGDGREEPGDDDDQEELGASESETLPRLLRARGPRSVGGDPVGNDMKVGNDPRVQRTRMAIARAVQAGDKDAERVARREHERAKGLALVRLGESLLAADDQEEPRE
jgi:hypothetical protein